MQYTLEQWRTLGNTIKLRGHEIFLIDSGGDKPVLVLAHGYPTSSWDLGDIWHELCEHFRVLVIDFLGLGFSAKPWPYKYSILEQADLLKAAMQHCGVEQAHVLAHDYGDTVAQELLARDNARKDKNSWDKNSSQIIHGHPPFSK